MRHPFDGVNSKGTARRGWLRAVFASLAGLFVASRAAAVAPPTTKVVVADKPDAEPADPKKAPAGPTTEAVNEEGAAKPTTFGLSEEGAMTARVGEAGRATSLAVGEEGGARPRVRPAVPVKPPVDVTSLAIGEEG